jgi:hypothetical protein
MLLYMPFSSKHLFVLFALISVSDYIFSGRWKETIKMLRGKETNSRRQLRQSLGNSAIIIKQARNWYDLLGFYCLSLLMCFGI